MNGLYGVMCLSIAPFTFRGRTPPESCLLWAAASGPERSASGLSYHVDLVLSFRGPRAHMNATVHLVDSADNKVREAILGPLVAFNTEQTGDSDNRSLVLAIEDSNQNVVGGLWGRTSYGWLFVELLFIPEALRGMGLGTQIMLRAEEEAIARGCKNAWLDTFQFQARGFYEKLHYRCFGQLDDYPKGFCRYFMTKELNARPPTGDASSP